MRIVICDRCGSKIPQAGRIGFIDVHWRPGDGKNPYAEWDLCEKCMEDIVRVIDFKVVPAPDPDPKAPEPGPDPDQEDEKVCERMRKTQKRRAVDKGKVYALADAAWTIEDIADDVGASSARARQILKERGEQ